MTKQEFLAMSLPYDLKGINKELFGQEVLSIRGISSNDVIYQYGSSPIIFIDLILRPLSDLTKEIEHKGEKFNPSYKLGAEIINGIDIYKPSNFDLEINIETPNYSTQIDLFSGFLVVQKLIEWHFDIADLISKGEAIDVNTLEINPYK